VSSITLGVVSVAEATSLQQKIGALSNHIDVRLWLSRGRANIQRYSLKESLKIFPLESSVASVEAVRVPRMFVFFAGWVFAVGMGIYLGSRWQTEVDLDLRQKHQNVFITFVVLIGLLLTHDISLSILEAHDQDKRIRDFALEDSMGVSKSEALQKLEEVLEEIQNLQKRDVRLSQARRSLQEDEV
jgi:hypothetical protein